MSNKHKQNITCYEDYKKIVVDSFTERLETCHNKFKCYKSNKFSKSIQTLHARHVICSADKAAGNYVFICQKYYTEVICKEIGIDSNGVIKGNDTYAVDTSTFTEVIERHNRLRTQMGIVSEQANKLPKFYGLPKLHKNYYKFRFIAAAPDSSTTALSLELHRILVCVKKFMTKYCSRVREREGRNLFWSIEIAQVQMVRNCKVEHMVSTDFSTLFTKLPHSSVKSAVFQYSKH